MMHIGPKRWYLVAIVALTVMVGIVPSAVRAEGDGGGAEPPAIPIPSGAARTGFPNLTGGIPSLFTPPSAQSAPPAPVPVRRASGMPPADENRFSPDEVVFEVASATPAATLIALEQRQGLTRIDQFGSSLTGTALLRSRIARGRGVRTVIAALEAEPIVLSAQPNYRFVLLQANDTAADQLQYALARLRLPQAHQLARGASVFVAIIDSGVDGTHPELRGAIAAAFDAVDGSARPDRHGTAIAGLIAAHGRLTGSAPAARILAARAFDRHGANADGNTFAILKCIEWSAANSARVINMSFAGPTDLAMHRALDAAWRNGTVLVAASGNGGAKSPPLYPAADPDVIAVAATDADDNPLATSGRGPHVTLAAPGADILVVAPGGAYQVTSGTSVAAAEVSGIVALMLERWRNLAPSVVRAVLLGTAPPIAADAGGVPSGLRMADAYMAVTTDPAAIPPRGFTTVSVGGK
jgi:subtilisin family serine protease